MSNPSQFHFSVVGDRLPDLIQNNSHLIHSGVELDDRLLVLKPAVTFQVALDIADDWECNVIHIEVTSDENLFFIFI